MSERIYFALGLVSLVLWMGCSTEEASLSASDETTVSPASQAPERPEWEDPEPPEAQALAEEVLRADWNKDKTTRLEMSITVLVNHVTGIEGFRTRVAGTQISLAERLSTLRAEETDTEVTIRLPGSVLFDFDSAEIRPDAEGALSNLVEVLKAYRDRPVRVEGHTDSISSEAYNQRLSEGRATAVEKWLGAHGIADSQLTTMGRGESQPVASNETAEGRQKNRRVEIVIEKQ